MKGVRALVIVGPTGSGKSAAASLLRQFLGGLIINADSKQVYKEIPIITDQPLRAEGFAEDYELYGHVPISDHYSVARWLAEVSVAITTANSRGKLPIVVGGSVMYVHSLINGLSRLPNIDKQLLAKWEELYNSLDKSKFADLVQSVLGRINPYPDRYRSVRNLAIFEQTGQQLSEWHEQAEKLVFLDGRVTFELLVLMPPRALLYQMINARALKMVDLGVLDEVKMVTSVSPPNKLVLSAVGVQEFDDYLKSTHTLEEAIIRFQRRSRKYAKRQMTWCRQKFKSAAKFFEQGADLVDYCCKNYR